MSFYSVNYLHCLWTYWNIFKQYKDCCISQTLDFLERSSDTFWHINNKIHTVLLVFWKLYVMITFLAHFYDIKSEQCGAMLHLQHNRPPQSPPNVPVPEIFLWTLNTICLLQDFTSFLCPFFLYVAGRAQGRHAWVTFMDCPRPPLHAARGKIQASRDVGKEYDISYGLGRRHFISW